MVMHGIMVSHVIVNTQILTFVLERQNIMDDTDLWSLKDGVTLQKLRQELYDP
jgi:hypothetical protein